MSRVARVFSVIVLATILVGCASTSIRSSWTAPDVQGPLDYEKILVVFMDPQEATRRAAEDALVARIGSDRAVASHTLFTAEQVQSAQENQDAVRNRLQSEGFDAAVAMRMVGEREELTYTPGMTYPTPYGGFYGFYGYGWGMAYDPGYLSANTIVSVETNVYDLADDKLVWSGVSETLNPTEIRETVNEIATAIEQNLRSQGLLD